MGIFSTCTITTTLGWLSAQNYVMGTSDCINAFNIYKRIVAASSPSMLLSELADCIHPLPKESVKADNQDIDARDKNGIYQNLSTLFY